MNHIIRCGLALAGLLVATSANAESGFYIGGGIGLSLAESEDGDTSPQTSDGNLGVIGVTTGYRHDLQNAFVAGELDADFGLTGELENEAGDTCDDEATDPYFCEHDATIRLRGLVGTDLGGFEVFGSAGFAMMFGQSAVESDVTDSASVSGFTLGLGGQKQFANAGMVRFEVIYDRMTNTVDQPSLGSNEYDPDWEATTAKVTYLYSF